MKPGGPTNPNHEVLDDFERFMTRTRPVSGRRFYRYTKDPGNSSREVESEIDRFLKF